MPFRSKTDKRRKTYVRFITDVQYQLQNALAEERTASGKTQSAIADAVGVDKSFVHRALHGGRNLTTQTIADLAWALNRDIVFELRSPAQSRPGSNWVVTDTTNNQTVTLAGDEARVMQRATPTSIALVTNKLPAD